MEGKKNLGNSIDSQPTSNLTIQGSYSRGLVNQGTTNMSTMSSMREHTWLRATPKMENETNAH